MSEVPRSLGIPVGTFVLLFGLLVGSFLNVVIARVPAGESVVHPRSRCPKCHTLIPSWHNIPVLSWLILRGRCAVCKTSISIRYPVVELLTGLLFLAAFRRYGLTTATVLGIILSGSLVAVTFIDIDVWEIPDEISLPGVAIGCALRPLAFDVPWYSGLVGAVMGAALLFIIRWTYFALKGPEAMGMGDVKLLAMIGAFLGVGGLLPVLLTAAFSGSIIGGILVFAAGRRNQAPPESEPDAAAPDSEPDEEAAPNSGKLYGIALIQRRKRRWLGAAQAPVGRTHVRIAWVCGYRGPKGPGWRSVVGVVQETPGWGHFEGLYLRLGRHQFWLGPMLGEREPLVEDDVEWTPPPGAFPFGPFLALGALAELLFGPELRRIFSSTITTIVELVSRLIQSTGG